MAVLKNRAKMSTSTTGTGTITLGSAEDGYQTFADAGVANADVVRYVIEDGSNFEIGTGTYTASGTTLSRTVSESSNSDAAINLSGSATVFIGATAEDIPALYADNYDGTSTLPSATGTNALSLAPLSTSTGINSVSIGSSADATGNQAFSFGVNSSASGLRGISFGSSSFTNNIDAVAIGSSAQAQSVGGLALGHDATVITGAQAVAIGDSYASGADSFAAAIGNNTSTYGALSGNTIAIGLNAKANPSQTNAIAIGGFATSSSTGSIALGYSSSVTSTGLYGTAIGRQASVSGQYGYAIGYDANVAHNNSVALGTSVSTTAANQISLGSTSDTVRISETYTLPTSDGTANQVLTTDGSGAVTFADAGGGSPDLFAENYDGTSTLPSATGTNALALQDGAVASANRSIAVGRDAVSSGNYAVALGVYTDAINSFGTALGYKAQTASSDYATALTNSRASGSNSFAAAIANNTSSYGATGSNSISIGQNAKATGVRAYALGRNSIASSTGSYSIGDDTTASQLYAMAYGKKAKSDVQGKHAFGTFTVESSGDIQGGLHVLYVNTTDATAVALSTSNSAASTTNQVILPNNSAYSFSGTIIARESAAAGSDYASWEIKGALLRDANAASTVLGNGIQNKLYATSGASAWAIALSADTTNGGLAITVTGAASTNIRWVATVNTSEVTYA